MTTLRRYWGITVYMAGFLEVLVNDVFVGCRIEREGETVETTESEDIGADLWNAMQNRIMWRCALGPRPLFSERREMIRVAVQVLDDAVDAWEAATGKIALSASVDVIPNE